jgi:cytochrome c553
MMARVACLVVLAACARDAAQPEAPQPHATTPDTPVAAPAPHTLSFAARYHMRAHFDDLRRVERLLIAGKLDEGTTLAYMLVRGADDPGIPRWDVHAARVADAALRLTHARGLDEALRREARVAAECASCHTDLGATPMFAPAPLLPRDDTTRAARMARHAWAADRLWEGLIAGDEDRWTRGLAVLADSPLPFTALTDAPALATMLQRRAREQLDTREMTLPDARATAYGEMLVTCAACHASLHVAAP